MSRHTSWHVGGPAECISARATAPTCSRSSARCPRARRCSGSASAATCWCATAASAASSSTPPRTHAPRARQRHHAHLRGRRALRAPRAPVHQVGARARGIPRRHSRHARRRAGDERGRVRRRDLAARAQRRRLRCARQRDVGATRANTVRLSPHRAAGRRASTSSPRRSNSSTRPGITEDAMRELLARRKETQPIGEWSCGSTFTNPPGDHAARLIEAAGLKGFRIGDIMVSPKHANFLVNVEAATRRRRRALVAHDPAGSERAVRRALTPEFRIVGESL